MGVHYSTRMCGAEKRTAIVVTMVNVVKMIKQNLSITMAANFQSDSISFSSSIALSLFVINRISFSIHLSSLLAEVQPLFMLTWLVLTWFMSELGLELFSWWNPFSLMKPPPDERALKTCKMISEKYLEQLKISNEIIWCWALIFHRRRQGASTKIC